MSFGATRADYFPDGPTADRTVRTVDEEPFREVAEELTTQVFTPMPELGQAPFQPPPERLAQTWNVHREIERDSEPLAPSRR